MEAASRIELDGQYRALREEAGFLPRQRGVILVKGPDATEGLPGQLTNDLDAVGAEEGCYAALLDRKGHMQADMRVLRLSTGHIWLDTEPAAMEAVVRHLRMYSVGREVEIEDGSDAWAVTSLIGPAATEAAARTGPLQNEHAQRYFERQGIEVLAVATDLGLDLITRAEQASELRELLADSGAVEVLEAAAEILRVEAGRPRFGREMSSATIPRRPGSRGAPSASPRAATSARRRSHACTTGKAQSSSAGAPARGAGRRRRGDRARGSRGGADRNDRHLPRPRPDRARGDPPRGRARGIRRGGREPGARRGGGAAVLSTAPGERA